MSNVRKLIPMMLSIMFISTSIMMMGVFAEDQSDSFGVNATGTIYYVDGASGSNSNNGTSPSSAWATVGKVSSTAFSAGDTILFKRGIFYNSTTYLYMPRSGTRANPITVGSYGTGSKPHINMGGRTLPGVLVMGSHVIIKDIIVSNTTKQGFQVENLNSGTRNVQLIDCEAYNIGSNGILHSFGGSEFIIKRFKVNNTGNSGIALIGYTSRPLNDVWVEDCWVSNSTSNDGITLHEGGTAANKLGSNFTLIGNHCQYSAEDGFDITSGNDIKMINNTSTKNIKCGIQLGHSAYDVKIIGHHSWDEGTHPRSGASVCLWIKDVLFKDCIFEGGNYHTFMLVDPYSKNLDNVTFENNIFAWGGSRDIFYLEDEFTNLTFKNNIFFENESAGRHFQFFERNQGPDHASTVFENNLYYSRTSTFTFYDIDDGQFNVSVFQNTYGQDLNAVVGDPDFEIDGVRGLSIDEFSPAIDAGVNTTRDRDILSNPIYGRRDIGPLEYQPKYEIGIDSVKLNGEIRIYSDSKYRYIEKTTSTVSGDLEIVPFGGWEELSQFEKRESLLDVEITTWERSGNYSRQFTVDHNDASRNYNYTIGGFQPSAIYEVYANNRKIMNTRSDSSGEVVFNHNSSSSSTAFKLIISGSYIEMIDKSPYIGYTGDSYGFNVDIKDDDGISSAWVAYRYQGSTTVTNSTLPRSAGNAKEGTYGRSITIPTASVNNMFYRMGARNQSGTVTWTPEIQVEILDNDKPSISSVTGPTGATTGDAFSIGVACSDNIGVKNARVKMSFDNKETYQNFFDNQAPYTFSISALPDSTTTIYYSVIVKDDEGNSVSSSNYSIPVTDNDAPSLVQDETEDTGYTGNDLTFSFEVEDNIDIGNNQLKYWYGNGPVTSVGLNSSTIQTHTVKIEDTLSILHYCILSTDGQGNIFNSSTKDITIEDDDDPVLNQDLTPRTAGTGNTLNFRFNVTDNIMISTTNVEYWFGEGASTTVALTSGNLHTANIAIPTDSLSILHYRIKMEDSSGNSLVGDINDVTVLDDDSPFLVVDSTTRDSTTGENAVINISLEDNIEIDTVNIEYWFGTGARTNQSMSRSVDNEYELSIDIPEDCIVDLNYRVISSDVADNYLVLPEQVIRIFDNDDPTFGLDFTTGPFTTGDKVQFIMSAYDNTGISNVTMFWEYSDGLSGQNELFQGDMYSHILDLDESIIGLFSYYFVITDRAGNEIITPVKEVTITDNDDPVVVEDLSPSGCNSGDTNDFLVEVSDNVGIGDVTISLEYQSVVEDHSMKINPDGKYLYSMYVPSNYSGRLEYQFTVTDTSENTVTTTERSLQISDLKAPTLVDQEIVGSVQTGESVVFKVHATDNMGISGIKILYSNEETQEEAFLTKTGQDEYSCEVLIPAIWTGDLIYRFLLSDISENSLLTENYTVSIEDILPPTFSNTKQTNSISRGNIEFLAEVEDNVGIDTVILYYSFNGGPEATVELVSHNGSYIVSLPIPEEGFESLVYWIRAYDLSGNVQTTSEMEMDGYFFEDEEPVIDDMETISDIIVEFDEENIHSNDIDITYTVKGDGKVASCALFIDDQLYSLNEFGGDLPSLVNGDLTDGFTIVISDLDDGEHQIWVSCFLSGGGIFKGSVMTINTEKIPEEIVISSIDTELDTIALFLDEEHTLEITFFDSSGSEIPSHFVELTWIVTDDIGTLDENLVFHPATIGRGTIVLNATMNGRSIQKVVTISIRDAQVTSDPITVDSGRDPMVPILSVILLIFAIILIVMLVVIIRKKDNNEEPVEVLEPVIDDQIPELEVELLEEDVYEFTDDEEEDDLPMPEVEEDNVLDQIEVEDIIEEFDIMDEGFDEEVDDLILMIDMMDDENI